MRTSDCVYCVEDSLVKLVSRSSDCKEFIKVMEIYKH